MQPRCLVILCKEVEEEGRFVNSKSRKLLYIGSEILFVFKNSNFNKCLGRNEKPYPGLVMNADTDAVFWFDACTCRASKERLLLDSDNATRRHLVTDVRTSNRYMD